MCVCVCVWCVCVCVWLSLSLSLCFVCVSLSPSLSLSLSLSPSLASMHAREREFESSFQEFRSSLASLHTELESLTIGDRMGRTKLEEKLRAAMVTLITAYKEGMEDLRQDLDQTVETESGGPETLFLNRACRRSWWSQPLK